jgi:hypothetical protein
VRACACICACIWQRLPPPRVSCLRACLVVVFVPRCAREDTTHRGTRTHARRTTLAPSTHGRASEQASAAAWHA